MKKSLLAVVLGFLFVACGGGGNFESGTLIEGKLEEAGGASHKSVAKHGENQPLEEVTICALGECTKTDKDGLWGFVTSEEFHGGPVEFTVDGHGISTTFQATVPAHTEDVFLHLQHVEGGKISIHHMEADGEEIAANPTHSDEESDHH